MVIKDKVLNMLAKADGNYVSGEDLARSLGVSRNAIWKAINALRGQGVFIHAATNKGYRLGGKVDILSEELIRNYLEDEDGRFFIDVRREVASTNTVLKQMAETGAPEGTVLIAQEQTGGKGRLQRPLFLAAWNRHIHECSPAAMHFGGGLPIYYYCLSRGRSRGNQGCLAGRTPASNG